MFVMSSYGHLVTLRMAELLDAGSTWSRRSWTIGTLGHLCELLEAGTASTPASARQDAAASARRAIEMDPAVTGAQRGLIIGLLPRAKELDRFVTGAHSHKILSQAVAALESAYIASWVALLQRHTETEPVGPAHPDVDATADLLIGHLQYLGFSGQWIVNACNYELTHRTSPSTLADLLTTADRIHSKGAGNYTFLIPLSKRARIDSKCAEVWLGKMDFAAAWSEAFPDLPPPQHVGGLKLSVLALDKHTAVARASEELARAELRVAVASRRRQLVHGGTGWMAPGGVEQTLRPPKLFGVSLPTLDADGGRTLFSSLPDDLETSLELLLGLESASSRTAVVSTWAALESLLADAGDFGHLAEIADRAADVLACSFVAAEMASLAAAHSRAGSDALAQALRQADAQQRVVLVTRHLATGGSLQVSPTFGELTYQRMTTFAQRPDSLLTVRDDIATALRRLYRTRNSIAHRGGTMPRAFDALLDSARVLLGALFDRFVSGARAGEGPPGAIAAKAGWAMVQVRDGRGLETVVTV